MSKFTAFALLALAGSLLTACGGTSTPSASTDALGAPAPDLVPTASWMLPTYPTVGRAVQFGVTVKNAGKVATPEGKVITATFSIDGTAVSFANSDATPILPGESVTVYANASPGVAATWVATGGTHQLSIAVNDPKELVESDYANDSISTSFTVGPGLAEAKLDFFGMILNHILPRPATGNLATPFPSDAPWSGMRLWDVGTAWWDLVPKARGVYAWDNFDTVVGEVVSHGKDVLYTFGRTPQWALATNLAIKSITRTCGLTVVTVAGDHTGVNYVSNFIATDQTNVKISGIADASFDGTFPVGNPAPLPVAGASCTPVLPADKNNTFVYAQPGLPDASHTGLHGASIGTYSALCSGSYAPSEGCAEMPYDLNDWTDFVTEVVTRANGRIKYWEIWNEINLSQFWKGDKATMVTMLERARAIIKTKVPDAFVFAPAVTVNLGTAADCAASPRCGETWIREFLQMGGKNYVDALAFHNYPSQEYPEQVIDQVAQEKLAMAAGGVADLPLWDTESSWTDNSQLPSELTPAANPVFPPSAPYDDQIAFMARHFIVQASLGVQRSFWYTYDGYGSKGDGYGNFYWAPNFEGPEHQSGITPAGEAYDVLATLLANAEFTAPCAPVVVEAKPQTNIQTWTCPVTLTGNVHALVAYYGTYYLAGSSYAWNDTRATGTYVPSTAFGHYKKLDGTTEAIVDGKVTVSEVPILLVP